MNWALRSEIDLYINKRYNRLNRFFFSIQTVKFSLSLQNTQNTVINWTEIKVQSAISCKYVEIVTLVILFLLSRTNISQSNTKTVFCPLYDTFTHATSEDFKFTISFALFNSIFCTSSLFWMKKSQTTGATIMRPVETLNQSVPYLA